ncbi:MAG: serine/threonine protein kinase [Mycoplasma sp.]|nr:serine/threonine protein kinase [Candidatus Hennigella equi]
MSETLKIGSKLYDSQYIVDKVLGSGADGDVYIVHLDGFPRTKYAAKVFKKPETIDDEYWRKRSDEALTAMRISQRPNPNLAKTHNVLVTPNNDIVLIMEYIDGVTLRKYLNEQGCITPKVALNIFKKMLNGVKQLHGYKQKIIHRDLKPENIMVSYDLSKVIIVDFGISSVVKDQAIFTNEKWLYGTASYILPDLYEQYKKQDGVKNISVQSDFYSLGVILYEMIMGTLPFDQVKTIVNGKETVDAAKTIKLPLRFDMINISSNPTIPPSLENIIYRCIASKKNEIKHRYNDIDEIIDDVNKCIPLLDKKNDTTPLLKPVDKRFYQTLSPIEIDLVKSNQKWYKQWYFFAIVFVLAITIIVAAIIYFFVII